MPLTSITRSTATVVVFTFAVSTWPASKIRKSEVSWALRFSAKPLLEPRVMKTSTPVMLLSGNASYSPESVFSWESVSPTIAIVSTS